MAGAACTAVSRIGRRSLPYDRIDTRSLPYGPIGRRSLPYDRIGWAEARGPRTKTPPIREGYPATP